MKRMRGRHHHQGRSHHHKHQPLNRNHVFDSNGPDVRLRGTSQQLFEKYLQLGRDATSAGDRVQAESYFQHAEHYYRILMAMQQAQAQQQQPQQGGGYGQHRRPMPVNGGYDVGPDDIGNDAQGGEGQPQFEEAQLRPPPMAVEPTLQPEAAIAAELSSAPLQAPAPAPQAPTQPGGPRHHGPRHRHPRGPRGPRGEHGGEGGERPESEAKPGPTGG